MKNTSSSSYDKRAVRRGEKKVEVVEVVFVMVFSEKAENVEEDLIPLL